MNRRVFLSCCGQVFATTGLASRIFAETHMPENTQSRRLSFSNDWIESLLLTNFHDVPVEDAIVVNLSTTELHYRAGGDEGRILPWKSVSLRHCTITNGERAALLLVHQRTNLGGLVLSWDWYGQRNSQFPRKTPLYISSQDEIGDAQLDPLSAFRRETSGLSSPRRYRLTLNLWYTPEETDCGIHTGHQFLEVHTQILGTGHMQKFRENNSETLYEDVVMSPGYTHEPFFTVANDRSFNYPWHRYYADTDCVWLAVEIHPV